jgi:quercetin 2,3-dioxygenase
MVLKKIQKVILPPATHWVGNGFRVHGFFNQFTNQTSPFLLLDYASSYNFEPSKESRGVGDHPHKGFETVTIAFKGKIAHKDNQNNHDIIGEGDVQWMTAGSGIVHQEFFEEEFNLQGGEFQMVQLWVNLPAKDKLTQPGYQAIANKDMLTKNINQSQFKVIAGNLLGVEGKAKTFSPIEMYVGDVVGECVFELPAEYNTMILVVEGNLNINQQEIATNSLVVFDNDGQEILVISGMPLNEPIAHYGPFVMNTQEELISTFNDFQAGKFGI